MPRLIDADALKRYIDCGHLRSPTELCFSELDVILMLDRQPTVEVEPAKNSVEHPKIKTHFARIIVGGEADKPYYSIMYYDPADNEFHQGFGSFCKEYVFKWLSEEFEIVGDVFLCDPVQHGRWTRKTDDGLYWYECSECGERPLKNSYKYDSFSDYCPNCGARMDGGACNATD